MDLYMYLVSRRKSNYTVKFYWHNANQFRNWVVNYSKADPNDLIHLQISRDTLAELMNNIHKILQDNSLAPKLLPTDEDYAVGSAEYNEEYFKELSRTYKALSSLVGSMTDNENVEYIEWW